MLYMTCNIEASQTRWAVSDSMWMTADGHRLCDCAAHGLCVMTSSDISAAQTILLQLHWMLCMYTQYTSGQAALVGRQSCMMTCSRQTTAGRPQQAKHSRQPTAGNPQQANHSRQITAGKAQQANHTNSKVTGPTCLSTDIRLEPLFSCITQMLHNRA